MVEAEVAIMTATENDHDFSITVVGDVLEHADPMLVDRQKFWNKLNSKSFVPAHAVHSFVYEASAHSLD